MGGLVAILVLCFGWWWMLDRCYRDGLEVGCPLQRSLAHPNDIGGR